MTLTEAVDIKKDYRPGETVVYALRGIDMTVDKGFIPFEMRKP